MHAKTTSSRCIKKLPNHTMLPRRMILRPAPSSANNDRELQSLTLALTSYIQCVRLAMPLKSTKYEVKRLVIHKCRRAPRIACLPNKCVSHVAVGLPDLKARAEWRKQWLEAPSSHVPGTQPSKSVWTVPPISSRQPHKRSTLIADVSRSLRI
jgi:hypothetical protein